MSESPYLVLTTENPHTKEVIYAEFGKPEIWALAQLAKRLNLSDCRASAVDDDEAYLMADALARIRRFLAGAGVAPR